MSSDESGSGWSGSGSEGERGMKFKLKKDKKDHKDKKDKKDKDKKDKKDKDKKDKDKKDKKDKDKDKKDKKEKEKDKKHEAADGHAGSSFGQPAAFGAAFGGGAASEYLSSTSSTSAHPNTSPPFAPPPYGASPGFPSVNVDTKAPQFANAPPAPMSNEPPPSGFRVPLRTDATFPTPDQTGPPVANDADGSPIFVGSALFETSVHPCKIGPHLQPWVSVPYGGSEYGHHGRFDLLPFVPEQMEWVPTSYGQIPQGRRPIEGGYEENGGKLYHALAHVQGIWVPGKAGEHLGGANVAFGGAEIAVQEYQILCWR